MSVYKQASDKPQLVRSGCIWTGDLHTNCKHLYVRITHYTYRQRTAGSTRESQSNYAGMYVCKYVCIGALLLPQESRRDNQRRQCYRF